VNESPFWWSTLGDDGLSVLSLQSPVDSHQSPVISQTFDVVVVGAGYTGLSAARQLARTGRSVLVLERHEIGWGASSRNAGQVLAGLKVDPATLVARYGEARARQLFDISLESITRLEALVAGEGIACEYERTGHIQAAWKRSHFDHFRQEQALLARVFKHRVELVPESEQRSELGSGAYHGLMVDERSGGINPAQFVHGLASAATRAGASLMAHTPVRRIVKQGARWNVAIGEKKTEWEIEATDVLWATNGYSDGATPLLRRRLIPIGSYIIVTEPLGLSTPMRLLPRRRMVFDSKHFLYYFRLTSDSRLLFGGRAEFSQPTRKTARRAAGILRTGMVTVFPELVDTQIDFAWGGNVAFTRDQMPHAGRLDDGAYFAAGYSGHGIAMATYLGEIIARRIAGEAIDHPFMDDRFAAIPLYRGHPWFLPIVGAYYKALDVIG
jgi:glycine/D-amino acid oxidase-like deaminating enzyme